MEQWVHILAGLYAGLMLVNLITYMLEFNNWGFHHPAMVAILFALQLGLGVVTAVFSIMDGYWLEVLAGAGIAFMVLGVCQLLSQDHLASFADEPDWSRRPKWLEAVLDASDQPVIYVVVGILALVARFVLISMIAS